MKILKITIKCEQCGGGGTVFKVRDTGAREDCCDECGGKGEITKIIKCEEIKG